MVPLHPLAGEDCLHGAYPAAGDMSMMKYTSCALLAEVRFKQRGNTKEVVVVVPSTRQLNPDR